MSSEALVAFRDERMRVRQVLMVPTVLTAICMMSAFVAWDIAREGHFGTSASVRLTGTVVMLALLAAVQRITALSTRGKLILLYVAFYGWQLAVGTTLGADAPKQLPGLIIIMFASILALICTADTRLNIVLALISVPDVLPPSPTPADWLHAIGLLAAAVILVSVICAQLERSAALGHLYHAQLEHENRTDPLTGLYNRRAFDSVLRREISRSARSGEPLSIAVIDIDHFKAVNDRFGHDVGDDVLRQTAELLLKCAREVDVLVRLGGEEFGVVMVNTTKESARVLMERLRTAVEAHRIEVGKDSLQFTISAGIAEHLEGEAGWDAMYQRADRALYSAKAQGRNQVLSS